MENRVRQFKFHSFYNSNLSLTLFWYYLDTSHLAKECASKWCGKNENKANQTSLYWCIGPWITTEKSFICEYLNNDWGYRWNWSEICKLCYLLLCIAYEEVHYNKIMLTHSWCCHCNPTHYNCTNSLIRSLFRFHI